MSTMHCFIVKSRIVTVVLLWMAIHMDQWTVNWNAAHVLIVIVGVNECASQCGDVFNVVLLSCHSR